MITYKEYGETYDMIYILMGGICFTLLGIFFPSVLSNLLDINSLLLRIGFLSLGIISIIYSVIIFKKGKNHLLRNK